MMAYKIVFVCLQLIFLKDALSQSIRSGHGLGNHSPNPIITDASLQVGDVALAGDLPVTGTIKVCGSIPVYGLIAVDGSVPAAGNAIVNHGCGCGAPMIESAGRLSLKQ